MAHLARVLVLLGAAALIMPACATGVSDDGDEGSGGAATGSSSTGGTGTMTSSSSGGSGCQPDEHVCDGVCNGNTPLSGCFQSTSCTPCPTDPHGTPGCTSDGLCKIDCTMPYLPVGDSCGCPTDCCANGDCDPDEICEMGMCKVDCSMGTQTYAACVALCGVQNKTCDPVTCSCV